jgi:8-oxo-dGTP diphosphatase
MIICVISTQIVELTPKQEQRESMERPAVAVDVVLFTLADEIERHRQLQVLLTRRYDEPFAGRWCLPGDWVRPEELLDHVALRELAAAGVEDMYLEQLYTFDRPERDPRQRVISVAYFALLRADAGARHALNNGVDARWWNLDQLPQPMAFDHHDILRVAVDRLRSKLEYTTLAFLLLPEVFTLPDLKQTYETILGEELDRGNFYRKIKEARLLQPTGRRRESGGRPAALYCFRADRTEGDFVFRWREARSARRAGAGTS